MRFKATILAAVLICVGLLIAFIPAHADGSDLQACGAGTGGSSTNISCSMGSAVGTGDTVAAFVAALNACPTPEFSDIGTATLTSWGQDLLYYATGWTSAIFAYVFTATVVSGGTLTIVFDCGESSYYAINVHDIGGAVLAGLAVGSGEASAMSAGKLAYASGDILISQMAWNTNMPTPLSGWTNVGGGYTYAGANGFDSDYLAPSSSSTFSSGWSAGSIDAWYMINAVFVPPATITTTSTATVTTTITSTTTTYNSTTTTTQDVINNQGAFAAVVIGSVIVCFVMIAILVARRR